MVGFKGWIQSRGSIVVEARGWMQSDKNKGVNARGVYNRHEKPPQKCRFPRFANPKIMIFYEGIQH